MLAPLDQDPWSIGIHHNMAHLAGRNQLRPTCTDGSLRAQSRAYDSFLSPIFETPERSGTTTTRAKSENPSIWTTRVKDKQLVVWLRRHQRKIACCCCCVVGEAARRVFINAVSVVGDWLHASHTIIRQLAYCLQRFGANLLLG